MNKRGVICLGICALATAAAAGPVAFSRDREAGGVYEVCFDAGTNRVVGAEFAWQVNVGDGLAAKRAWQRRPIENFDPKSGRLETFVPTDAFVYCAYLKLADGREAKTGDREPQFRSAARQQNFAYAVKHTEPRVYTNATGKTLGYRWHAPAKLEPGKKYPLVLFLHGAGERGSDNGRQLIHGVPQILKYAEKTRQPIFLVAGQVSGERHPTDPAGHKWSQVPWEGKTQPLPATPSDAMAALMDLVAELRQNPAVDAKRLYVTGLSMGGYGTWDFTLRRPDWVAAAMPLCGGTDDAQVARAKNVPMWVFHGADDSCVLPCRATGAVAALKKAGGNVRLTMYPGVGHDCWTPTYSNDEVLAWLFAQRR